MKFTQGELNLISQWFGCVQDISHPNYLENEDYRLAKKIYETLGARVPNSITDNIKETTNDT